MQVILLEKVQNVGDLGEVVKVKPGFARNYLIPHGKAKRATPENVKLLEAKRAELEHAFKFNDAVLRHLIVAMREAVLTPSPMMKEEKSRSMTAPGAPTSPAPAASAPAAPAPATAAVR